MATYAYDEFRVSLTRRADGSYDARALDANGVVYAGVFHLPYDESELEQAVLRVARGRTRRAAPSPDATRDVGEGVERPTLDAERLGGALADALFSGEVGAQYEAAVRRAASARRRGVRLTLSLAGAPELLSVPWEFLYRRPRFLAAQRRSPIVRHLDTESYPAPPSIPGTVKILGVVAGPDDLAPLDVGAERARVEKAVSKVVALGRVELDWLEPATPRRLREVLRDGTYDVLHYVGHSDFHDGDGVLYLERADGRAAPVDGTELANLLSDQERLRLVVLNSCEGARTTLTDPYAGVATTLVQLGVPAVVAMQFEISDAAAILFAEELYTNLIGRQDPIHSAVAEARKALYIEMGNLEWATPVLFMGDTDVELFHFEIPAAPLPPPPPPDAPADDVKDGPDPTPARRRRRVGMYVAAAAVVGIGLLAARSFLEDDPAAESPDTAVTAAVTVNVSAPATVPADGPPTSADLPAGGLHLTGAIGVAGEPAVHRFGAQSGDIVLFDGPEVCDAMRYSLAAPSGEELVLLARPCDRLDRITLAEAGDYEITIEGENGAVGNYDLTVLPVPADEVIPLPRDGAMTGEIDAPGAHDVYTMSAESGDIVLFDGPDECGAMVYSLTSPSGARPVIRFRTCDPLDRVLLAETGEYRITIEGQHTAIGAYRLAVLGVPPDDVSTVEVGDTLAGEIESPGAQDVYVFNARSQERVRFVGPETCDAMLYSLTSPSGARPLIRYRLCDPLGPVTLGESGEYRVTVEGQGAATGAYTLRLLPA